MCFEKVSDVKNKNLPVWGSVIQRHRCRCVAYICVLVDMFLETVEDISINMVIKDIEPMNLESLYLIKNFINILSGITKKIITISFICMFSFLKIRMPTCSFLKCHSFHYFCSEILAALACMMVCHLVFWKQN